MHPYPDPSHTVSHIYINGKTHKHTMNVYYVNQLNSQHRHHMVVVHSDQSDQLKKVKWLSVLDTLPMETQGLNWLIKAHNLNCGLDSRVLALECTWTMTPSSRSTSSNQADIPNSNYGTGPTDPDQNTYSQKQWASLFAHKGNTLWTLFIPRSPLPLLLLVQSCY